MLKNFSSSSENKDEIFVSFDVVSVFFRECQLEDQSLEDRTAMDVHC